MRRTALIVALALTGLMLVAPAAGAFNLFGPKWPGNPGKVTYYSSLTKPQDEYGLQRALRAWNGSSLDLKFAKASKRKADIRIVRDNRLGCGNGFALMSSDGRNRFFKGKVWIGGCPGGDFKYPVATVATHELGHVLGLDHEDRRCATMNSMHIMDLGIPSLDRPTKCPRVPRGEWRCRPLERDDYEGAKRLYGGRIPAIGPYSCPLPANASLGVRSAMARAESLDDDFALRRVR